MTKNKVKIKPAYLYGWNGHSMTNQDIEIGITPSIGGRIISLKFKGKELLFVDHAHMGETFNFTSAVDLKKEKQTLGFRLWGGDKTWVAPESKWIEGIPPIDLDASEYTATLTDNSIKMTSPIDRETGLQIIREISLDAENNIFLNQTFINKKDQPISCGIWDVTQHLRPSEIFIPIKPEKVKPDTRFPASVDKRREIISAEEGLTKICCTTPWQFKYGAKADEGYVIMKTPYDDQQKIVIKRTFEIDPQALYPHDDHMIEVYNSNGYPYFELEVLGPLVTIEPEQSIAHQQKWQLGLEKN